MENNNLYFNRNCYNKGKELLWTQREFMQLKFLANWIKTNFIGLLKMIMSKNFESMFEKLWCRFLDNYFIEIRKSSRFK